MTVAAILDTAAFLLSFIAISKSPISLLLPLSSFGPVFTVMVAVFTLGEKPVFLGFLGILLTVVGAYLLNIGDIKKGILKPFESLISQKGAQLFLLATLIWAITPIFQKKAIFETHPTIPLFASFVGTIFVTIFIAPFALKKMGGIVKVIKLDLKLFLIFGLFNALTQLAAYTAFSQANVGYVTAIMRMTSLFGVILGGKLLKEEKMLERLLGASVMIAGALLIVLRV